MRKRRTVTRQSDLPLGTEPFALFAETGVDGARVTADRSKSEARLAEFEAAQRDLVHVNQKTRCPTCAAIVDNIFDHVDIDCQHD